MNYKVIGKDGSLLKVLISEMTDAQRKAVIEYHFGYSRTENDDGTIQVTTNKSHRRWLDKLCYKPAPAATEAKGPSFKSRHIELLERAQEQNKKTGNAWRCTLANVDAHSLPPEWEDQWVCYVYQD